MALQKSSKPAAAAETVRMAVLATLVVQNTAQAIFMRSSFSKGDDGSGREGGGEHKEQAAATTAVMMAEVLKLVVSLFLQLRDDGSLRQLKNTMWEDIIQKPVGLLKMAVPSCLYVLQNNLNYVAMANLDAPTFQLLYQLKILTTALFSVIMLKRELIARQWLALAMLALGVWLVQWSGSSDGEKTPSGSSDGEKIPSGSSDGEKTGDTQNPMLGFAAVMSACCTSGFAGVYFEKVLKGEAISLWVRNMQLSAIGILMGSAVVWRTDGEQVAKYGFFYGYNFNVWMAVLLNSLGGLVVAMVVKYADNVIKGFATSISILLTALVSFFVFGFDITIMFIVGAYFVLQATFLYSTKPPSAYDAAGAVSPNGSSLSSVIATTGVNASKNGNGNGQVEMPEKESLLQSETSYPSTPIMKGRGVGGVGNVPRKNSGARDGGTPV